jgi:two-component system, chemotaxis family, protein-glutamate methylesterase/glutaminase
MTMRRIRVLLVEDSLTIRRRLSDVLAADPEFEVVGEAENGKRAIELCLSLSPDVITLDMILPIMTGLDATEHIMAHCPTPILVVSSSVNRGELFKTYDALAAGAVDVLEKPRGDEPDGDWELRFRSAVKLVSRIKVITHPRARLGAYGRPSAFAPPPKKSAPAPAPAPSSSRRPLQIVALGASTGGPGALVTVLRALPAPFPVPVVIVMHIDEPFGGPFADWLGEQTRHPVSYPADGELVRSYAGRVAMAPPGRHLTVSGKRFSLTTAPPRHSCRPSIDVLFEALAREYGASVAACLLTGMGRDGAPGLLEIRRAGGLTIAQDENTSIVYGMPREAVLLGAAERVLPLEAIGDALAALVGSSDGVES